MPQEEMPMYSKTLREAQTGTVEVSALPHAPTIAEMLRMRRANLLKELEQIENALKIAEEQKGS